MNTTMFALPALLLIAACNNSTPGTKEKEAASIITPVIKSRMDSTLKSFIDSGKTAAVSALVFEKGKEVYYNAFGYMLTGKQKFLWIAIPSYASFQ